MRVGLVQTGRHDFSATFDPVNTRKRLFRKGLYAWLRQALVLNLLRQSQKYRSKVGAFTEFKPYVRQGTASPSQLQGTTAVRPAPLSELRYQRARHLPPNAMACVEA